MVSSHASCGGASLPDGVVDIWLGWSLVEQLDISTLIELMSGLLPNRFDADEPPATLPIKWIAVGDAGGDVS